MNGPNAFADTDSTTLQRDILTILAVEHPDGTRCKDIRQKLKNKYGSEVPRSTLYQNLSGLVRKELINKEEQYYSDLEHRYCISETGRSDLINHLQWCDSLGLADLQTENATVKVEVEQ